MLLSIIIVSYNTKELTIQALESVVQDLSSSKLLDQKSEIIVIDNNSEDDSVLAIKNLSRNSPIPIAVIENPTNTGFAQANNFGVQRSKGKYILLLNSDVIVKIGALEKMVETMESIPLNESTAYISSRKGKLDRLGILAATLLNRDGTLQPQGGAVPTLLSVFTQMFFLDDLPIIGRLLPSAQHTGYNVRQSVQVTAEEATPYPQDWVGGTAMLVRRVVFDEIGLLDQNIFMYGEDVELCMRARAHHWDVAIHPGAHITHYGSASSSSKNAILGEFRGFIFIWAKHKPLWQMPFLKLILRMGCLLRIFLFSLLKKKEKASIYMMAIKDVLR
jgi:GT2 family glycosyltransferase